MHKKEETTDPQHNKPTPKPKKNNLNWAIPLLLVLAALGALIFSPAPQQANTPSTPTSSTKQAAQSDVKSDMKSDVAKNLVSYFFNATEDDKTALTNSLSNTVNYINKSNANDAKQILSNLETHNLSGAIQSLTEMAKQQTKPEDIAKIWVHIGNIQNLTSPKQALQAYIKACELDSDNSEAWNRQAHAHHQLNNLEAAESAYKKVKALNSENTTTQALFLMNLGKLSIDKNDLKTAEESFIEALTIFNTFENTAGIIKSSENLAKIYEQTSRNKKAETHYLIALKAHKENDQTKTSVDSHLSLAKLYQKMNQAESAQKQYKQALNISLNNSFNDKLSIVYNALGTLSKDSGEAEKAKSYFEKALLLDTSIDDKDRKSLATANKLVNLATVNRRNKKYPEAEKFYLKAIEIYIANNNVNSANSQKINLGFLYKVWGRTPQACTVWKDALGSLHRSKSNRLQQVRQLIQQNCYKR